MWLTGFDAPCMHTMYVDKPMRGHGLMQAIARVNRVFHDKPGGLIVDYIGIAQNLKAALSQYSQSDRDKTGIDEEAAVAALLERYEVVKAIFQGFDYRLGLTGRPLERLNCLGGAIDWVLKWAEREALKRTTPEDKKAAYRRYQDLTLELRKAFALASASDAAREIADEVGFFQAVRAALIKTTASGKLGDADRALAVHQLIDRAIASAEIVDILKAAGIKTADISILSDEFLLEVAGMEHKNLALEALRKLLNGEIKSRARTNVVESRAFSERLEAAVARYHAGALSALEMIQELIDLAKDLKAAEARGEESGLSQEELAFYDALAEHEKAVQIMGVASLRVIAHELVDQLSRNVTVDWQHRESARAQMRVLVRRILRRFGYPPDLSDAAVQNVLAQAETLLGALA
jgi:type I restriction enzyme R subunit